MDLFELYCFLNGASGSGSDSGDDTGPTALEQVIQTLQENYDLEGMHLELSDDATVEEVNETIFHIAEEFYGYKDFQEAVQNSWESIQLPDGSNSLGYWQGNDIVLQSTLDTQYTQICERNSGFENRSALGLSIIMRAGDIFNGNYEENGALTEHIVYVNGKLIDSGVYSIPNGFEGTSIVRIWLFAPDALTNVVLNYETDFQVIEYIEKVAVGNVHKTWYQYAQRAVYVRSSIPRSLVYRTSSYNMDYANINQYLEIYGIPTETTSYNPGHLMCRTLVHHCTTLTSTFNNTSASNGNMSPIIFYFPDLTTITGMKTFQGYIGTQIIFDNLVSITGNTSNAASNSNFFRVRKVIIPETTTTLGSYLFSSDNSSKPMTIVLNCKNATDINTNFCIPANNNNNYVKAELCDDWGATINLTYCSYGWDHENYTDFMDLLSNPKKLRDMTQTNETRNLTLPQDVFEGLQATTEGQAALAIAEAKGWSVGGA